MDELTEFLTSEIEDAKEHIKELREAGLMNSHGCGVYVGYVEMAEKVLRVVSGEREDE